MGEVAEIGRGEVEERAARREKGCEEWIYWKESWFVAWLVWFLGWLLS